MILDTAGTGELIQKPAAQREMLKGRPDFYLRTGHSSFKPLTRWEPMALNGGTTREAGYPSNLHLQPTPLPHIRILLSTFNGSRFIKAQLQSLLDQNHTDWTLAWRDDGSSDDTVAIMRAFTREAGKHRCIESPSSGPHLGAAPSFLRLLSENQGHNVAFADQDDVWLSDKLLTAAAQITGDTPTLYCARQFLVDENLGSARLSAAHDLVRGFPAALTQNIANGNTLVMNHAAAELVSLFPAPEGTVHDWWSYIVVSACGGKIVFDTEPTILYRLHKNNLIGSARPFHARALAALRRGSGIFMTMMRRHTDALATHPEKLTPQARMDLQLIRAGLKHGLLQRLAALRCTRFRRRTLAENILFSYWFLIG